MPEVALWKAPVAPKVIGAYARSMMAEDHSKAQAADTSFRFSDAMNCARALGYKVAGVPESDLFDGPSLIITAMGSMLHEEIQAAYAAAHPNAVFESKAALGDLTSGHIDIDDEESDEAVEIKTVGAYKFDTASGIQRKGRKRAAPKGPDVSHICQGGFNARARGRRNVRIVYLSREAISFGLAADLGLGPADRICAEWLIPPEIWEPIVDAELARLEHIREMVQGGGIPDRQDFDGGKEKTPEPEGSWPWWRCNGYCQFRSQCVSDGPGVIPVPVSIKGGK